MANSSKRAKNHELLFSEKVKLIEEREKSNKTEKKLAEQFNISISQVHRILQKKDHIMIQKNNKSYMKRVRDKPNIKYESVDRAIHAWFCNARSHNIPVNGIIIQTKALQIAREQNPQTKFIASNGWLDKFLKRNDIVFRAICGEGSSVNQEVVESWTAQLPIILANYKPEDIYNIDGTGLFFKQLPRKSYVQKGDECIGTKTSKLRLTICLFTNSMGHKEPPIVIGNAKRPRCFGRLNVEKDFNIKWHNNKTSWMTSVIFEETLKSFNSKMKAQGKKVLLFLDNAPCHPDLLFSNVKLIFFPPNVTSACQPLDQGIIKSFKVHYRNLLMRRVISMIDSQTDVLSLDEDIIKPINVLDAISWINQAWTNVKIETIKNCFFKCGFPAEFSQTEELPIDLPGLTDAIDVNAFVDFDSDTPITDGRTFSEWEQNFMSHVRHGGDPDEFEQEEQNNEQQSEQCDTNNNMTRGQLVEQLKNLQHLKEFAIKNGSRSLLLSTETTIRKMEWFLSSGSNLVQTAIQNFFEGSSNSTQNES